MKLDENKHSNLVQLLGLLVTLIIFLTFITSLTLERLWKLEDLIINQQNPTRNE